MLETLSIILPAGEKDELSVLHGLLIGMLSLLFPKHVVTLDLDSIMIVIIE